MPAQSLGGLLPKYLQQEQESEDLELLDESQAGIRANRTTTGATDVSIRINEDLKQNLKSRSTRDDAQATLLDWTKAYPE